MHANIIAQNKPDDIISHNLDVFVTTGTLHRPTTDVVLRRQAVIELIKDSQELSRYIMHGGHRKNRRAKRTELAENFTTFEVLVISFEVCSLSSQSIVLDRCNRLQQSSRNSAPSWKHWQYIAVNWFGLNAGEHPHVGPGMFMGRASGASYQ